MLGMRPSPRESVSEPAEPADIKLVAEDRRRRRRWTSVGDELRLFAREAEAVDDGAEDCLIKALVYRRGRGRTDKTSSRYTMMTRTERMEKAMRVVMLAKKARGMVVTKRKGTMRALTGLRRAIVFRWLESCDGEYDVMTRERLRDAKDDISAAHRRVK
jgi:hypothetical protein